MRALVTGATGFLGSHVASLLVGRAHDVRVLVRTTSDRSRLEGLDLDEAIGDVTDEATFTAAADGVDAIFHCAAMYTMGPPDPSAMEAINVGGVANAVAAARSAGATLVHVSSVTALGTTGAVPADEGHWNDAPPVTVYERTKRAGHEVARHAAADGVDVRIGIPGGIYGPGDTSVLGVLIERYLTTFSPLGWRPDGWQSTVHVDDCADGLLRIAERGRPGGEYLLVAEHVTFREWFRIMAEAGGQRPPMVSLGDRFLGVCSRAAQLTKPLLGSRGPLVGEYLATIGCDYAYVGDRARDELGWDPRPLAQGMEEWAALLRSGGGTTG